MAVTHKLIQTITVGAGGAASIDFTSIPATYTDLLVLCSVRTNRAADTDGLYIKINGTNGTARRLLGDGATATSDSTADIRNTAPGNTVTASTFGNVSIYLPNYAGSTNKSLSIDGVGEGNTASTIQMFTAGLWSTTTAINQITLLPVVGTLLQQYSSASLYGIKNS